MVACIPMGRVGKLYELGYLATFLASPASDFITGQIVFIDGGCLQFSPYKCKQALSSCLLQVLLARAR